MPAVTWDQRAEDLEALTSLDDLANAVCRRLHSRAVSLRMEARAATELADAIERFVPKPSDRKERSALKRSRR